MTGFSASPDGLVDKCSGLNPRGVLEPGNRVSIFLKEKRFGLHLGMNCIAI